MEPGDHVGILATNCIEWVEAAFAAYKLRASVVNINYRYVEDELRYLFANSDVVACVFADAPLKEKVGGGAAYAGRGSRLSGWRGLTAASGILGANLGWPFMEATHSYKGTAPAGLASILSSTA